MATVVSTPAELDAVREALGANYEKGANIDLYGYGSYFQRFAVDDASALSAGMVVYQYYGEGYQKNGQIWNIDGNNLLVKLLSSDLSLDEGMLNYDGGNVTVSFSTAPYDGSVVQSWIPIGVNATGFSYFSGTFDGKGYSVRNMNIWLRSDGSTNAGLFGRISGTVENLGVLDSEINATRTMGLIAAFSIGTIKKCKTTGKVTANETSLAGENAGGILGWNYSGTIEDCWSDVEVSGNYYSLGGIVGVNRNTTNEKRCHAVGTVVGDASYTDFWGPVVGSRAVKDEGYIIENCYYDKTKYGSTDDDTGTTGLTSAEMKDVSNFSGWDFSDVWYMGAEYPELQVFGGQKTNRFGSNRFSNLARNINRFYFSRFS